MQENILRMWSPMGRRT